MIIAIQELNRSAIPVFAKSESFVIIFVRFFEPLFIAVSLFILDRSMVSDSLIKRFELYMMFLFETALSFLTLCFFNSYIPDYSLIGMISTILCLIVAASTRWKTRLGGDFFASIVFFSISAINIVVHIIFGYSSGCILQYAQGIALAVTLLFNSMYFVDGSIKGTLKKIEIPILDYHSDC